MIDFTTVLIKFSFDLALAIVAIMAVRFTLKIMTKKIKGFDFNVWIKECNDHDKAIYFSARFIAVCLLVGLILS